jgi:hypothetical protein
MNPKAILKGKNEIYQILEKKEFKKEDRERKEGTTEKHIHLKNTN